VEQASLATLVSRGMDRDPQQLGSASGERIRTGVGATVDADIRVAVGAIVGGQIGTGGKEKGEK